MALSNLDIEARLPKILELFMSVNSRGLKGGLKCQVSGIADLINKAQFIGHGAMVGARAGAVFTEM